MESQCMQLAQLWTCQQKLSVRWCEECIGCMTWKQHMIWIRIHSPLVIQN